MPLKSNSNNSIEAILAENQLDSDGQVWIDKVSQITASHVERELTIEPGHYSIDRLLTLTSSAAKEYLEQMATQAMNLTTKRFGKTIKLYAPLYLSNYCVSNCRYCGFNRSNTLERKRLTIEQAVIEADIIASEGFRDILLVSGEDREYITVEYLKELTDRLRKKFSSISIEIYQMTQQEYAELFASGVEGVTIYQETYNRKIYDYYHMGGVKTDYNLRLSAGDSICKAGMREVGLGALLGLYDWRIETLALAQHANYLMNRYWKSHVSISFPRLRPASHVDSEQFQYLLDDVDMVQMILALRLCFADVGLVLSTREPSKMRDNLVRLGITRMSAGSKTSPGGYSQNNEDLQQFEVDDNRPPHIIAEMLKSKGLEAVWKDWDTAFIKS